MAWVIYIISEGRGLLWIWKRNGVSSALSVDISFTFLLKLISKNDAQNVENQNMSKTM